MYEFMILAQLGRRPMHGYMIAKIIGHIMGPFRQVQWGALYPVLSRLAQDGLIKVDESPDDDDGRVRKVYSITDAGEERLHEHLMDTERHLGEYENVFMHKVAHFHRLTRDERLQLSRHYLVYAQRNVDHLERKCRDLNAPDVPLTPEQKADVFAVMEHRLEHWRLELAWAKNLIEQYQHPTRRLQAREAI